MELAGSHTKYIGDTLLSYLVGFPFMAGLKTPLFGLVLGRLLNWSRVCDFHNTNANCARV